jgi:hypothetical protein
MIWLSACEWIDRQNNAAGESIMLRHYLKKASRSVGEICNRMSDRGDNLRRPSVATAKFWFLRGALVCCTLVLVSACVERIPPTTAEGRKCVYQAEAERAQCMSQARANIQACLQQQRETAEGVYQEARSDHERQALEASTCERSAQPIHDCDEMYNIAFKQCGGRIE